MNILKKYSSFFLVFLGMFVLGNQAVAQTSKFEVPILKPNKVLTFYDFNYGDVKNYIYKKEKARKIDILVKHLAKEYKLNSPYTKEILYTLYNETEKAKIDPLLFLSVIEVESSFDQFAKSHVGAIGLSQVMPQYHQNKIRVIEKENLDLWSVRGNIKVGVKVLQEYISMSDGNIEEALQRYNGSLNDLSRKYARKVLTSFKKYKSLFS